MLEVKKHVMGNLKKMLDDRMASRMKPKSVGIEVDIEKKPEGDPGMGHGDEGSPMEEAGESPAMEMAEHPGMDKLSPEEQQQLQALYHKMGC